ncbi:MAG: ABC transporter ATP-binding protein [Pseudomonadota bacterium]
MASGITLENISFHFDQHIIIDEVSFSVDQGDIVCLLGPSGCGKTTILRLLSGLENPNKGRVLLNDREVFGQGVNIPTEKRRIGFLFQDYALFPHLDVRQNIEFGVNPRTRQDLPHDLDDMLKMVDMVDYVNAMPHTLSGGQQQRIALARALAPNPEVLLLDEPFSGLDTALRVHLRQSTHKILKKNQVTTIMVTHDPEEAMFMADKIVLMQHGRVVQMGSPRELYLQPKTLFCADFFADTCAFRAKVVEDKIVSIIGDFLLEDLTTSIANRLNKKKGTGDSALQLFFRPESLMITIESESQAKIDSGLQSVNNGKAIFKINDVHFIGEKQQVDIMLMHRDSADASAIETLHSPVDQDSLLTLAISAKTKVDIGSLISISASAGDILWLEAL